jgi:hypothetical protein
MRIIELEMAARGRVSAETTEAPRPTEPTRSAPNQRRIDSKRLAYLDQTLVQRVQTGAMM